MEYKREWKAKRRKRKRNEQQMNGKVYGRKAYMKWTQCEGNAYGKRYK